MTRKEALTELLAKVEAGEDPGFDLWASGFFRNAFNAIQSINGSLDAAKALHEAVLPEWHYAIDGHDEGCEAEVFTKPEPAPKPWHCATVIKHQFDATLNDNNPARAWLIAILKALIAECDE